MVQVIESKLEIGHVTKPVSLPFEGFDFVVDSFYEATRDAVEVVVQEPMTVVHECGGELLQFLDPGVVRIRTPCIEERDGLINGVLFPELN